MFAKVPQSLFAVQMMSIIACLCKLSTATNTCCYFDNNECAWSNYPRTATWTWSTDKAADTTSVTDYQSNTTPNEWLQDTSLSGFSAKTALKVSTPLKIERNDVVSINFYRHTPSGYTDDRLMLIGQRIGGASKILLKAQSVGWQTLKITCSSGNCCVNYPCIIQFQVEGILKSSSDLLAFDEFVVNDCLVTTSPATGLPTTVTTAPLNLVTVQTTTVTVITTVTSTTYNQTTSTKPITTSDTRTTSKSVTAVTFRN